MAAIDDLVTEVTAIAGVVDSAIATLTWLENEVRTLEGQLAAAGVDTAKIVELQTALAEKRTALAEAIAANPIPAPEPEPAPESPSN